MWKCELCGKSDTPEDKICKIPGSNNKFALGECIICKKCAEREGMPNAK